MFRRTKAGRYLSLTPAHLAKVALFDAANTRRVSLSAGSIVYAYALRGRTGFARRWPLLSVYLWTNEGEDDV